MKNRVVILSSQIARTPKKLFLSIGSSKICPICGWSGHAFITRHPRIKPALTHICPNCNSSERHHFAYFALRRRLQKGSWKTLHFKQKDHVRLYGRDKSQRLKEVGYQFETLTTASVSPEPNQKYHFDYPSTRENFLCRKPILGNENRGNTKCAKELAVRPRKDSYVTM